MNSPLSKIGRYQFLAEPFHCDFSNRLFMGHLGNHLLNAADFHSNDRGFGMNYLNAIHKTWVLSRLCIEVEEMPEAYDKFFVETWVESAMRYFTHRNFVISMEDGSPSTQNSQSAPSTPSAPKILGYGKSIWAMIDTETRQPQDILAVKDGDINNWIEAEKTTPLGSLSRVKMSKDAELCHEVKTTYNDVDVNGHINSVKYIEHILDIFPIEHYKTHKLKRIDIAYVAESHGGDTLRFYKELDKDGSTMVSVRKITAEGEEEVVRCKLTFDSLSMISR